MSRILTDEEVRWLKDHRLPPSGPAAPPLWPPGQFFKRILGCKANKSLKYETAYLMLVPGKHLHLRVRDAAKIEKRFSLTVFHGTSLGACGEIMSGGMRPVLGTGSEEAGKPYNCSLPMFYTSALLHTAQGYVGNARTGQSIGEGPVVNCVLWLKADPDMRLYHKKAVKNKAGKRVNEQQGYHPKHLVISDIFLHCVASGTVTPAQARPGQFWATSAGKRRNHTPLKKNFDGVAGGTSKNI